MSNITAMLDLLRNRVPPPGETGVQRISFAFGQVALSRPDLDPEHVRRLAEQAVCARYEEEIATLKSRLERAENTLAIDYFTERPNVLGKLKQERDDLLEAVHWYARVWRGNSKVDQLAVHQRLVKLAGEEE